MVIREYIKALIEGEVPRSSLWSSPFWVFIVRMYIFEMVVPIEFRGVLEMMVGHHIWRGPIGFG
jgi:hypothetical protein